MITSHKESYKNYSAHQERVKRLADEVAANAAKKQCCDEGLDSRISVLQKELDSLTESKDVALHILTAGQDALCKASKSNILKRPSILAARQMVTKGTSALHDVEKRIQEKVDELGRCIGKRASSV